MLFSSVPFLFFFFVMTLGLYYLVPWKWKNHVLLLASVLFYASGEPRYVILLMISATDGSFLRYIGGSPPPIVL